MGNMLESAPRPLTVCFYRNVPAQQVGSPAQVEPIAAQAEPSDVLRDALQESDSVAPDAGADGYYEVVFDEGPLGLGFRKQKGDSSFMVERVQGAAEEKGVPPGDYLYSVGDTVIRPDMSQKDVVNMLKSAPRPVTICFYRNAAAQQVGSPAQVEPVAVQAEPSDALRDALQV